MQRDLFNIFNKASQSSHPQMRKGSDSFFARTCAGRKIPLAERTVRRRKLHIIRFDPEGQSSFISLLLLFKMEALLPF